MFAVVETLYVMARRGVVAAPVHCTCKKAILAPNYTQGVFAKYIYIFSSLSVLYIYNTESEENQTTIIKIQ